MQQGERRMLLDSRMDGNLFEYLVIRVDGSALSTSLSTAGLLIGAGCATAKDDGANVVTITFNEALPAAPIVLAAYSEMSDGALDFTSSSTTSVVVTSVKRSDHSAVNDPDFQVLLLVPKLTR